MKLTINEVDVECRWEDQSEYGCDVTECLVFGSWDGVERVEDKINWMAQNGGGTIEVYPNKTEG